MSVSDRTEVFRLGELFSGPGGIAEGARQAAGSVEGYRIAHAWATDYDRDTCDTYKHNFPGARVIHEDVRKLDIAGQLSPIDGLAFGFPCNDFSNVGERKGIAGEFGPLYEYGARVIDTYSPKWFVAENVGGLRNSNDGTAFEMILDRLQHAGGETDSEGRPAPWTGYRLYPHLYKFEEYGIPQRRHRILIVGIRDDLDVEFRVPSPAMFADRDNSVRLALSEIPGWAANQELTKQSEDVVRRLQHIKPGQNAFTADLPADLRLNVAGARISQIYKRLEADKPCYTITGSGGGGTHVYHWSEDRALTNRERARIQTFPDRFEFKGGKESVRKQIGMAVPVEGARIVFEAVLKSFAGIDYVGLEPNLHHRVPPRRVADLREMVAEAS
ncbi:DNA cytosine methyltransferase [Microbacterium pygmaeum]|uniref:Cytosine-specific methyltransferase n=1 Tax=Microbacterium pygmaeum TaxID=370764 RepID=A0A1G7YEB4_9MICO|nr:DNA (cytosine-5-)-methyltransferase [Microbacterium pygmaeum]SDG94811.1 DNA (cytosine-5)-methyltransferase 1 [Microbacterium pygmaeum]